MNDRTLLYGAALARSLATGLAGVVIGLHLASRGLDPATIGLVIAAGLAGAAVATLVVTLRADRIGHRRTLVALGVLAVVGGAGLLVTQHPLMLGLAAFVGMVNGMGRDRGGAQALEQAMLPAVVPDGERTRTIAIYTLLQDVGHGVGALLAAVPSIVQGGRAGADQGGAAALAIYLVLSLLPPLLSARLSRAIEPVRTGLPTSLAPDSRRILTRISALFALDGLGGGFLTTAMLAYFFHERFGVQASAIGPLFFGARVLNALSHVAAAWLARRIGLVNTMVFTHIPSSLLLVTVAIAPSFPVAAVLFLLREGLVEMDVPTRQSYLLAVVRPEERTIASGVTQIVRLVVWAIGPALAGVAIGRFSLIVPLIAAAVLKITYDVLLWLAFRNLRPPEERAS
jgi:MFS family permease